MSDDQSGFPNTRLLMTASAVFMAVLGFGASIFADEILRHFGYPPEGFGVVLVKIVAGLYLGLAVLNWMARDNLIGGIYSRPVAMANFAHFLVVTVVFVSRLPGSATLAEYAVTAGVNGLFAASFGFVLFGGGPGEASGAACG